jgi:hypothetical protein
MILYRIALILGVSIATLLTSVILDAIMSPLPAPAQVLIQLPALVLTIEVIRDWTLRHAADFSLTRDNIDAAFFFAAPLAAFASTSMFDELRTIIGHAKF